MTTKLTLGPVLFHWTPERLKDFYFRIADEAPLDVVYLGEVVCAKRAPFFESDAPEVVERLEAAGKEVVLSTLALLSDERDVATASELCQTRERLIEANDITCIDFLTGRPHVVGPYVNVYNEGTLAYLVRKGARRVVLPGEVPAATIAVLAEADLAELEVQVFGRLPLALSARCYHARSEGLTKDSCCYVCAEDVDGMEVLTLDGEPFLAVNGTQTLSHSCVNLAREIPDLLEIGVRYLRLSPQDIDMVAAAELFRGLADGRIDAQVALAALGELAGHLPFSNGFYHASEGRRAVGGGPPPS